MLPGEVLREENSGIPFRKRRTFGRVTALGGSWPVWYWDRGVDALHRGLNERVLNVVKDGKLVRVPTPEPGAFAALDKLAVSVANFIPSPTRVSRYAYALSFTGSRRVRYMLAVLSLAIKAFQVSDAISTMFVKAEKTLKAPRIIIFRGARFNVLLGTFLKHIEHSVYRAIDRYCGYGVGVVMKGKSSIERAAAIIGHIRRFGDGDWVAISIDAAKFDAHTSVDALQFEHRLYLHLYRQNPELRALLEYQTRLRAKGFCPDGRMYVEKDGNRCSGDVNTSLGNVWLMCLMLIAFLRGFPHASFVNDGDDSVIFLRRRDLPRFERKLAPFFLRLGYTMTVDSVCDVAEHIRFCQCAPVYTGSQWIMVRNPAKAVGQDLTSTNIFSLRTARTHCAAVGLCGGWLSRGVPVMQAFYAGARNIGDHSVNSYKSDALSREGLFYMSRSADRHAPLIQRVSAQARVSFWRAFGVTPAEQVQLEKHFFSLRRIGTVQDYRVHGNSSLPVVSPRATNSFIDYFLAKCSNIPSLS